MQLKKIGITATLAGALGAAALGLGAGTAQADDLWVPVPVIPDVDVHLGVPPGHVGHVVGLPPGQAKKFVGNVPPGHWKSIDVVPDIWGR
ncbi:hypothetical protein E4P42_22790 [Mycobacterium sp. PS03-16]|uniref:hypothetical protein n=1 Tax=Mycobacterium sp. PS03-16 TaxID=2559611 RepID=UPI0010745572|nr:hypothetical protein [Mycobacterium sp. PS03-16]TFV55453.1 hypothetical protein E4P42_22790 [Mycobacterium sp. PS03-16]